MDKLANYGSDDDYEDSPRREKDHAGGRQPSGGGDSGSASRVQDVNYDEVGMELSEDSESSGGKGGSEREERTQKHHKREKERERKSSKSSSRRKERDREDRRRDNGRDREDRRRDDSRGRRDEDKRGREDERSTDRRSERDDRNKYRDRDDKRWKQRSNSRERYRSRSPTSSRRGGRNNNERGGGNKFGYSRRHEKATNKMAHLEKMGIEIKAPEPGQYPVQMDPGSDLGGAQGDNKFFLPGVSGRLKEQMERRKLLWQKKEPEKQQQPLAAPVTIAATSSKAGKVWETTTFAQDQDGKQASKFKRLMGIRASSADGEKPTTDLVRKQEELFSSMEQQYEVARTATHTMRGVGLGFGSFQR